MEVISLVATAVATLMKPLTSPAIKECAKIWNADKELEKLIATHVQVKAILDNCDKNKTQTNYDSPDLEKWLQELAWYCYDIEDLVDDLGDRKSKSKRITTPHKIVELRERLELVSSWIGKVLEASRNNSKQLQEEGVSFVSLLSDKTPLVSGTRRDDDKLWIIRRLTSTSLEGFDGVSIVGMDGLGKSALARMIAAEDSIKSEFPLILCAHVAGHFRSEDVVQKLIASAEPATTKSHQSSVAVAKDLLQDKKVLIILDDLWSVTGEDWKLFKNNILEPSVCWKILATTRNLKVAEVTETIMFPLGRLKDVDCEHLIMETAHLSESGRKILLRDVKEIAMKCKGLPLIATTFGLTLSKKKSVDKLNDTIRRFKNCTNIMELQEVIEVLPRLMLNKPQLPPHLKRCFAYCSLFLPGHTFQKNHLIQFWEVEQLFQPEITGSKCFDDLLSRSIFEPSESSKEQQLAYEIHDFHRQFVENLASTVVLRIEKGTKELIPSLRHLSLTCQNINVPLLEQLKECKSLRTFLLLHPNTPKTLNLSYSSFEKLERLRVLDLSHTNICKLEPASRLTHLKPLKQLKYLDLSNTDIQTLPDRISRIFRTLEVLKLESCPKLRMLPKDLSRLISLRHLHVNMLPLSSSALPKDLGMLTNLESLSSYIVGTEEGYKFGGLRNMKKLREICISQLQNVSSEEAQENILKNMEDLSKLALEWGGSAATKVADPAEVLRGLEPQDNLKDLTIRDYPNPEFPTWLTSPSLYLVNIYLVNCNGCKVLPPLGQLPILKTLVLESFGNLEIVARGIIGQEGASGFPELESIEFRDMLKLHRCDIQKEDMPSLRHFKIKDCPNLDQSSYTDHNCFTRFP